MISMQRLPLQRTLYIYKYISIDLGNDRQEKIGSPEAVVILHPQHITYKKHCQSITTICPVTQRKGAVRDTTK